MNQKGEITLLSCLLLLAMTFLVILCGLELKHNYSLLEKRTQLFLCVKETKGEHKKFMSFMGKTNWGIKNLNKLGLITLFIPGLQGISSNAQKAKKYLQYTQEIRLISYLKTLRDLKGKSCPLDPRMFITPFQIGTRFLNRDSEGAAQLRANEWTYYYFQKPYLVSLTVKANGWEKIKPDATYFTEERAAKLSSLLSLSY